MEQILSRLAWSKPRSAISTEHVHLGEEDVLLELETLRCDLEQAATGDDHLDGVAQIVRNVVTLGRLAGGAFPTCADRRGGRPIRFVR